MTYRPLRGLSAPLRPYPQALAEQLARCRPGDARLPLLNALYADCSMADKLTVQTRLAEIQQARRIEMLRTGNVVRLPDRCVL